MASQMGAEGAAPPEGERNPAKGGYFASIYIYIHMYVRKCIGRSFFELSA